MFYWAVMSATTYLLLVACVYRRLKRRGWASASLERHVATVIEVVVPGHAYIRNNEEAARDEHLCPDTLQLRACEKEGDDQNREDDAFLVHCEGLPEQPARHLMEKAEII